MIPYAKEIDSILNEFHDQKKHQGFKETINDIKNNKYYWVSMNDDVKNYLSNCVVYSKK